ncbi:RNA polymerase sigma factor [Glacieibacterium sp.]|uniref:RNA polymerase sigma factor n=1 Tax=Glacieibacterium sp. TaxID=2860237 RepID=UPI003B00740E
MTVSTLVKADSQRRIIEWLSREILPHEAAVRRWLSRALDTTAVEDIIQESYCRIAGLRCTDHIFNGRAYFFQTARSLVLQQMRRSRVVRIDTVAELDALPLAHNEPSPERITAGRRELARVMDLIGRLPDRCRQVIEMRKIQGLSQRDVASILGVSEHVIENDVIKGLKEISRTIAEHDEQAERHLGSAIESRAISSDR